MNSINLKVYFTVQYISDLKKKKSDLFFFYNLNGGSVNSSLFAKQLRMRNEK